MSCDCLCMGIGVPLFSGSQICMDSLEPNIDDSSARKTQFVVLQNSCKDEARACVVPHARLQRDVVKLLSPLRTQEGNRLDPPGSNELSPDSITAISLNICM